VVSGFNDWRTVSVYRRHAGLHLGYDIVLPYGSRVPAAWPGKVVAITPWGGSQYGITVLADSGYEATYGHLSPLVRVGQRVAAGDFVGLTIIDHVDVKMRDSAGAYVDFGSLASARRVVTVVRQAEDQAEKWQARYEALERKPMPSWDLDRTAELLKMGAISAQDARRGEEASKVQRQLAVVKEAARKRGITLKTKPVRPSKLVEEGVLTRREASLKIADSK
jgi:hypothetical protein